MAKDPCGSSKLRCYSDGSSSAPASKSSSGSGEKPKPSSKIADSLKRARAAFAKEKKPEKASGESAAPGEKKK